MNPEEEQKEEEEDADAETLEEQQALHVSEKWDIYIYWYILITFFNSQSVLTNSILLFIY